MTIFGNRSMIIHVVIVPPSRFDTPSSIPYAFGSSDTWRIVYPRLHTHRHVGGDDVGVGNIHTRKVHARPPHVTHKYMHHAQHARTRDVGEATTQPRETSTGSWQWG